MCLTAQSSRANLSFNKVASKCAVSIIKPLLYFFSLSDQFNAYLAESRVDICYKGIIEYWLQILLGYRLPGRSPTAC